jgi:hypothetical protein
MASSDASRAWEVANDIREQEQECHSALEAAREASRALDEHLDRMPTTEAPTEPPGTVITAEWYESYRLLSRAREAGFRAFESCVERQTDRRA